MKGKLQALTRIVVLTRIVALTGIAMLAVPVCANPAPANSSVAKSIDTSPAYGTTYGRLTPFTLNPGTVLPALSMGQSASPLNRLGVIDSEFSLIDGIGLYANLDIDVAGVFDDYTRNLYGLIPTAPTGMPLFLTLPNGMTRVGVRTMLADGLRFTFGQTFRRAGLSPDMAGLSAISSWGGTGGIGAFSERAGIDSTMGAIAWDFAKWGQINLSASQTNERGGLALGNAASLGGRQIATLGISTHIGFASGWVTTLSYHQANTQLSLKPVGGSTGDTILHSQSYGIAVAKHGLFGHDALGLSLSRPTGSYNDAAGGMQFQFYGRDKLFEKNAPETDFDLGYVTTFLDGPLALQANASYQMNANGPNRDSVAFMSRAKIKF